MKFSIKDFFSKCDQIRSFLRIWSHLPNKFLIENFSDFSKIYVYEYPETYLESYQTSVMEFSLAKFK